MEQETELQELPPNIYGKFQRKDGGNWGFIGLEEGAASRIPPKFFNNSVSECANEIKWNGYQSYFGNRLYKDDIPYQSHLHLMKAIAEGQDISELSVTEKECLKTLLDEGFCVEAEDGRVQVAALSVSYRDSEKITEYLAVLPEYIRLKEEMHAYYDELVGYLAYFDILCVH